jgi:ABC-type transport system involved in multi-copper enzyme maturation permease subunit
MAFPNLVVHGLSAMSVYTDLIFTRVLIGAGAVSFVSLLALCVVLAIRFGTSLAIPGWASMVFGDLVIVLFQAMFTIAATSLMVLAGRSARQIVPMTDASVYIESVSEVLANRSVSLQNAYAE